MKHFEMRMWNQSFWVHLVEILMDFTFLLNFSNLWRSVKQHTLQDTHVIFVLISKVPFGLSNYMNSNLFPRSVQSFAYNVNIIQIQSSMKYSLHSYNKCQIIFFNLFIAFNWFGCDGISSCRKYGVPFIQCEFVWNWFILPAICLHSNIYIK